MAAPTLRVTFRLLPGEVLLESAQNVTHLCPYVGPVMGSLFLTNFKLIFEQEEETKKVFYDWKGNIPTFKFSDKAGPEVPVGMITRIEKIGGLSSRKENSYGIEITCCDFRTLQFAFFPENHSRRQFFESLVKAAFPLSHGAELFAFGNQESFDGAINGWQVFDLKEELNRQGVKFDAQSWRISNINQDFSLCDSYPQLLAVPAVIDDATLQSVASFRSRGRLPILSWVHPSNGASITRCSQPKVGMWRRNEDDERYLTSIRKLQPSASKLFIIDARPKANAMAQQAINGAGYESTEVYENTELIFMNIANIHVMRESLRKLRELCFPIAETNWYSGVDATKWLDHVRMVIAAANKIVELVDVEGIPCLVHCSDGWDRTAQLTALSTMMMDPFYRTLKGFAIIVEKEWIVAGHRFATRTGQGDKNYGDDQRAPIFLQFLDCVYQILSQFPSAFEFNVHFLLVIADELHSTRFGTFLHNNEKDRIEAKNKTPSLWSFVLAPSNQRHFVNPAFQPTTVLKLIPSLRRFKVWTEYYARWTPQLARDDEAIHRQWQLKDTAKALRNKTQEPQEPQA